MKSPFFLKNTSHCPVHSNFAARDQEFAQKVREIIEANGMSAEVYPAIWCETAQETVRGVLVELSYIFPSALINMAKILKEETEQEQILITTRSEFAPPSFPMTKSVACTMTTSAAGETESASGILSAAVDEYCAAQKEFRAKHYFNPAAVLYETPSGIKLFSFARLEVDHNFDYWQKMMGKFLGSLKKPAVFHFTRAESI